MKEKKLSIIEYINNNNKGIVIMWKYEDKNRPRSPKTMHVSNKKINPIFSDDIFLNSGLGI